jgi:hypothetical protein
MDALYNELESLRLRLSEGDLQAYPRYSELMDIAMQYALSKAFSIINGVSHE